ncbi:MAG TPA: sulfur carrier protein ThiS [Coriobacteriia bacterium]|jgi:thiamine biosynthesis protein ThiS
MAVSIRINGKPETAEAPSTVSAILEERRIRPEVVLVQVNGARLASAEFGTREVEDGDVVDILLQLAGGAAGYAA